LALRVHAAPLRRQVHLILENEHNQARWLRRTSRGDAALFDAQWNDDVHHVLHVAASGEGEGYYADYLGEGQRLGRAVAQGFAFQGELMRYRGSGRGEPSVHLPPEAFIAFIQNHDQIGNRALGERLSRIAAPEAVRAVTALYLLLPQIPMLFMGEEWHSTRPFLFFCDFDGGLAAAVRQGRREEFARFAAFRSPEARERIPDPQSDDTFAASKLDWERRADPLHAATLRWYRDLLAIRSEHVVPLLPDMRRAGEFRSFADGALIARWRTAAGVALTLMANLSARSRPGFPVEPGQLLWEQGRTDDAGTYSPWSLRWTLQPAGERRQGFES
jgi:malto-oligosyltrehalose trehalohydrolase